VTGNEIVDATDVGIVLYRVPEGTQASKVSGNTVIAAGRSAFAALAADPLFDAGGRTFGFGGSTFTRNTLWTGDRTHFDIVLAAGTRPWFGDRADKGTGAAFVANTTGSLYARSANPIVVSGMLDVTVRDNTLRARPTQPETCPAYGGVVASRADGWASGEIQGPVTDAPLSGCIGLVP
jgi:hypothetical protein